MNGKECRVTRREIDESDLNQRLSNQAQSHLAVCPACRDFRAERASLRELVGSFEPVAAPGDFDMRLRARIANEQARARQPFIFRFVTSTPAIVMAALVVMLATSLVWFAQRNRSQAPLVTTTPPAPAVATAPSTGVSTATEESANASQGPTVPVALSSESGKEAKPDRKDRDSNPSLAGNRSRLPGATSTDYGLSEAPTIKQIEQRAGEVSLRAPLRPMVVSMQDDRGQTHKISLPPVSFGAERLVGNRINMSTTNGRSW